jgi:sugar phosphate isomerase/epimerase
MIFPPGIFTKIFVRPQLGEALAAIAAHGLAHTQFNMSCAGLASLPDEIDRATQDAIRAEFTRHGIRMAAVSGTFNMIHPDPKNRADGLARLRTLIEACSGLSTGVVTLCSGTRDPDNMWRRHPGNSTPAAWKDLAAALEAVLPLAEAHGVILAIEPEPSNVIDRAAKGRRLLGELRSPNLKVVMDAANLFHPGDLDHIPDVLREAFDQLGGDIALAHAKDLNAKGEVVAAGKGVLDYDLYLNLLQLTGYTGPLILHSLAEGEVTGSAAYLNSISKR